MSTISGEPQTSRQSNGTKEPFRKLFPRNWYTGCQSGIRLTELKPDFGSTCCEPLISILETVEREDVTQRSRCSVAFASARLNFPPSNGPPNHSVIDACSSWRGSAMTILNSSKPVVEPQSSGDERWPHQCRRLVEAGRSHPRLIPLRSRAPRSHRNRIHK